ncbi:MAG: electron transport complex subunit RsxC [Treponema sp.]
MKMFTFKGGIYPPEHKELSRDSQITDAFPSSKTVTIPVTMGGAPNECVVKVGDRVIKGQIIAQSDKYMSAPVHASITGTVKKIEPHMVTGNTEAPCITIVSDGSDETAYMAPLDPFSCDGKDALKRIKDAGIVGMGGASFPTHVKLNPPAGTEIEYVILNAAECEPYLTIDYRTLKEDADKVVDGLAIELRLMGAHGIIALESNKADLLDVINKAVCKAGYADDMEVRIVKTKYPQGCEKNLTLALLGREIPAGGLPAAAGCLISNVGTVCAISDAFRLGKPLIERALTISGGACETPKNIRVPVGTNVGDLIPEVIQLKRGEIAKIISGGPMMGFAMTNAMFPIVKGTSGVLFLTKKETYLVDESPCIGCASCIRACPMKLAPVMMARTIRTGDFEQAKKYGLMDCIECGSCSYVCPAHIRLVQRFRYGKNVVRTRAAEAKAKAAAAASSGGTK